MLEFYRTIVARVKSQHVNKRLAYKSQGIERVYPKDKGPSSGPLLVRVGEY